MGTIYNFNVSGTMKRQYPRTPILGLTATATERVLAGRGVGRGPGGVRYLRICWSYWKAVYIARCWPLFTMLTPIYLLTPIYRADPYLPCWLLTPIYRADPYLPCWPLFTVLTPICYRCADRAPPAALQGSAGRLQQDQPLLRDNGQSRQPSSSGGTNSQHG